MNGSAGPSGQGIILEVCVDDAAGIQAAVAGGADRIELCSALALGGLTATPGLMALAARSAIPTRALIRPRAGGFHYSEAEVDVLRRDIDAAREAGLAGVVIGACGADGLLDEDLVAELAARARGMEVALHRAVDMLADPLAAVDLAAALGIATILTSGGATSAVEGAATIAAMQARAGGRVEILPGGGINAANAAQLLQVTGVRALHASCSRIDDTLDPALVAMGFTSPGQRRTDAALVRALRDAANNAA